MRWRRTRAYPPRRRVRVADPVFYLRAVIFFCAGGLLLLPLAADAVNAALRPVRGEGGACRVLSVIDGDTVSLWCAGDAPERARLTGFDTPEMYSPDCLPEYVAAQKAAWALRGMIFKAGEIRVTPLGRDRYERRLIGMEIDGVPVRDRMINAGHARPYDGGRRAGWCG